MFSENLNAPKNQKPDQLKPENREKDGELNPDACLNIIEDLDEEATENLIDDPDFGHLAATLILKERELARGQIEDKEKEIKLEQAERDRWREEDRRDLVGTYRPNEEVINNLNANPKK